MLRSTTLFVNGRRNSSSSGPQKRGSAYTRMRCAPGLQFLSVAFFEAPSMSSSGWWQFAPVPPPLTTYSWTPTSRESPHNTSYSPSARNVVATMRAEYLVDLNCEKTGYPSLS